MTEPTGAEMPEALRLADEYAETRHVCGTHLYNAKTEAARSALIAALSAAAPAVAPADYPHEAMDAMALARYKVVPSHESMFHRHAVVAGDGGQHIYVGREVECQNMARKFAGAFLDGAFAFHELAHASAPQQGETAGAVYAELPEQVAWRDAVEHCDLYWRPAQLDDLEPLFTGNQMRSFADATCVLRTAAPHAAAASGAPVAAAAPAAPMEWDAWRLALAEKVDKYIQADHDGEGDDEAYADLKAHILKTPFAAPQAQQPGAAEVAPIDMVLHCPACGLQHIDAAERDMSLDYAVVAGLAEVSPGYKPWTNPPHRSHLCHGCGHIWRPADVPTNGVQAVKTTGKADSPIAARAGAQAVPSDADLEHLFEKETGFDLDQQHADVLGFARAVLARWGTTPAAVSAPSGFVLIDPEDFRDIIRDIGQHIDQGVASERKAAAERPGYGTGMCVHIANQMAKMSRLIAAAPQAGAESYPPELDDAFSVARSALVHCPDRASVLVILATLRSRVDDTIDALRARGAVPRAAEVVVTKTAEFKFHPSISVGLMDRLQKHPVGTTVRLYSDAVSAPSEGDALAPLRAWWAMHEAQWELCEETPADDAIILHFMGSGASTAVTAGQLRAVLGNTAAPQAPAGKQDGGAS